MKPSVVRAAPLLGWFILAMAVGELWGSVAGWVVASASAAYAACGWFRGRALGSRADRRGDQSDTAVFHPRSRWNVDITAANRDVSAHVVRRLPCVVHAGRVVGVAGAGNGTDPGSAGPISLRLTGELAALAGNGAVLVPDESNVLGDHPAVMSSLTVLHPEGRTIADTIAHARYCYPYTVVPLPALPTLESMPRGDSSAASRALFDHLDAVVALVDHHALVEDVQHAREALLLTGVPLIGFVYLDGFRVFG